MDCCSCPIYEQIELFIEVFEERRGDFFKVERLLRIELPLCLRDKSGPSNFYSNLTLLVLLEVEQPLKY